MQYQVADRLLHLIHQLHQDVYKRQAFIYPSEEEPGKWVARGDIWNGKKGSGITQAICSTCESVDDAMKALEELAEKYPNDKDLRIFIDDLKE